MGKAQSKRSVDITTTEVATTEEGTGRVEKIEDVDQLKPQLQLNGQPHNEVVYLTFSNKTGKKCNKSVNLLVIE